MRTKSISTVTSNNIKSISSLPLGGKVTVRLGGELKVLFLTRCKELGVKPSEVLRQLVSEQLKAPGALPERLRRQSARNSLQDWIRFEIRVGQQEWQTARRLAHLEGFSSTNRWAAACIRYHLTKNLQFSRPEIEALAHSNYQLAAIGRNLNQLTREVHAFAEKVPEHRYRVLQELSNYISSHMEQVKNLLKANYERWN